MKIQKDKNKPVHLKNLERRIKRMQNLIDEKEKNIGDLTAILSDIKNKIGKDKLVELMKNAEKNHKKS
ncbi:MAG: hypothetical protein ACTSQ8_08070 [Candidatus Helarchaeota archaeon]